jgi:hypothetical protein
MTLIILETILNRAVNRLLKKSVIQLFRARKADEKSYKAKNWASFAMKNRHPVVFNGLFVFSDGYVFRVMLFSVIQVEDAKAAKPGLIDLFLFRFFFAAFFLLAFLLNALFADECPDSTFRFVVDSFRHAGSCLKRQSPADAAILHSGRHDRIVGKKMTR